MKKRITLLIIILFTGRSLYSQDINFRKTSIKTGIGIGINEGKREIGDGLVYSVGWQKSLGKKNRVRINPNMTFGGFMPIGITDTRDQFYRITTLGMNIHYDLIRFKSVAIVTTGGGFINYSRGLLASGFHNSSEYFHTLYFGGNASIGIRINQKKSKFAYEIRPLNIHFGNKGFVLGYMMFGVDFKIKEK